MILSTHGIIKGAGLDPVTVAWLAQLTTSFGSNPSSGYITALDTLIKGLRTDSNILALDRFWIFAQEVQGYARVSIVNPSSTQITEVNTPTFTVNQGYTGNGTTRYLNTNFNYSTHAVNTLRSSITHGVYITTNVAESKFDAGFADATRDNVISGRFGDGRTYQSANSSSGEANAITANSLGLYMAQRTSTASGTTAYKNGSSVATLVNADNALANAIDLVLAYNSNLGGGVVATSLSSKRIAMRVIGSGAVNAANFYTRFQTFATSIGFNV